MDILEAVHGYIKYFFGCTECGKNFDKAASKIPSQVKKPEDVILWLWKSHNRANIYTPGDPKFPKVQFPPPTLCPRCHKQGKIGQESSWEESHVLDFMIQFYTDIKTEASGQIYKVVSFDSGGVKHGKDKKLDLNPKFALGQNVEKQEKRQVEIEREKKAAAALVGTGSGWKWDGIGEERNGILHWTGLDKSLCLTMWAISTAVCLGLFAYFRCRRAKRQQQYGYGKFKV